VGVDCATLSPASRPTRPLRPDRSEAVADTGLLQGMSERVGGPLGARSVEVELGINHVLRARERGGSARRPSLRFPDDEGKGDFSPSSPIDRRMPSSAATVLSTVRTPFVGSLADRGEGRPFLLTHDPG